MQDVLIIIFKSQEFYWLSGYWSSKSCSWSTWTNINFYFNQTLIRSRDIEDWLICKCSWSRAFSHVHSKSIGYAYTFDRRLPAPRKSKSDTNAFKRYSGRISLEHLWRYSPNLLQFNKLCMFLPLLSIEILKIKVKHQFV